MVFLPFSLVSSTELCSFWYGLKDLFTLQKLADKVIRDKQNWSSQAVERPWGEWVKNLNKDKLEKAT